MKNWAFNPVVRLAVAVWALGAACSAWATGPWYVAMSGSGLDGLSWGTAYTNVQTAINAAADGDTIYLKGETFTLPVNNANGKLIWQSKTLTIDGGYAGTVGQAPGSVNGTNTTLQNTTAYSGDDLTKRVLYVSYVTNGLMRRVTVSGGSCSAGYQNNGGAGMYLANSPGMTLDSCQLVGNFFRIHDGSYETRGGGVYVNNSSAIFSNCVLQQNSTSLANNDYSRGGAIYLLSGSLTLVHSILYGNAAHMESTYTKTAQGGAIYVAGGILNLRDCLLYGNAANPGYPSGTSYAAVNQGDGIYAGGGTTVLQNCTVAYQPDDGVYQTGAAIVAITNSILWGNSDDIVGTVSLGSCDIENGDNKGTNGCFSANPLFEYGYYLGAGSPCTNAGSVSAAQAGVDSRTTRTDGTFDTHAAVDLGYHYPTGFDLTYADIYAATNGVDSNLGTNASAAYRTITNAFAHAQHGSRVHLAAGTYSTESWPLVLSDKWAYRFWARVRPTRSSMPRGCGTTTNLVS